MPEHSDHSSIGPRAESEDKPRASTGKIVGLTLAGVVLAGAAIFGGSVAKDAMTKKGVEYILEDQYGVNLDQETNSRNIDLSTINSNDFTNSSSISREQQVAYAAPALEELREQSLIELSELGYTSLNPGSGDISDEPQQIADSFTVDMYSVWKLGTTNPDEARKLLTGVVNPKNEKDYDRLSSMIGNGGSYINSDSTALDWTKTFYTTTSKSIPTNGNATRVITVMFSGTEKLNQIVFQQASGIEKDTKRWSVEKMIASDDDAFVDVLSSLPVN